MNTNRRLGSTRYRVAAKLLVAVIGGGSILGAAAPAAACDCIPNVGDLVAELVDRGSRAAEYQIAPSRPTNVTTQAGGRPRSIRLAWDASSPGVFGFAVYNVHRAKLMTSDNWKFIQTTDPSYVDYDVQRGASYRYFVEACDDRGNCSRWSDGVDVTAQ